MKWAKRETEILPWLKTIYSIDKLHMNDQLYEPIVNLWGPIIFYTYETHMEPVL